jgi:RNA polymerase sigma-70 factor (ECF subfamily)
VTLSSLRSVAMFGAMFGGARPSPEERLVRAVRAGDATALGEVYDAHHEAVRAFARRLLGDDAAAEDLVHDVFVALPDALGSFQGNASLRTFLISVAVNRARHEKRSTARRLGAYERLHAEPRGESDDPEHLRARRALAQRLSRCIAQLPMEQRVAIVLCVVEERTSVEAAEIVGVPEATMRTRVFHARRKLRELMESEVSR